MAGLHPEGAPWEPSGSQSMAEFFSSSDPAHIKSTVCYRELSTKSAFHSTAQRFNYVKPNVRHRREWLNEVFRLWRLTQGTDEKCMSSLHVKWKTYINWHAEQWLNNLNCSSSDSTLVLLFWEADISTISYCVTANKEVSVSTNPWGGRGLLQGIICEGKIQL